MKRFALCCLLLAVVSGCRYERAFDASEDSAGEDIVALLKTLVDRNPDDYISMYTLARFAERGGNTREALHWLHRLEATSWDRLLEDADFPLASADPAYHSIRDRLHARATLIASAEPAFSVDQVDLLPEGMAYDPTTDRFLVSSGRQRKVASVARDGSSADLVAPMQDGIYATLGMKVDDSRRDVWVASAAAPFMIEATPDDSGRSALYQFDADTGATKGRWVVQWTPSLLNDLVVAPDGAVFVTESMQGAVLRRLRGADEMDEFLPRETFFSPNGIAIADDGATLFVAHYHGISAVDVRTREVTALGSSDPRLQAGGIDGLYWFENRLIAIQNLVGKGRVLDLHLDGTTITAAEILEAGNQSFRNPTTGAIAAGAFFFMANPRLQEFDGGQLSPAPAGEKHRILWIPLVSPLGPRR